MNSITRSKLTDFGLDFAQDLCPRRRALCFPNQLSRLWISCLVASAQKATDATWDGKRIQLFSLAVTINMSLDSVGYSGMCCRMRRTQRKIYKPTHGPLILDRGTASLIPQILLFGLRHYAVQRVTLGSIRGSTTASLRGAQPSDEACQAIHRPTRVCPLHGELPF